MLYACFYIGLFFISVAGSVTCSELGSGPQDAGEVENKSTQATIVHVKKEPEEKEKKGFLVQEQYTGFRLLDVRREKGGIVALMQTRKNKILLYDLLARKPLQQFVLPAPAKTENYTGNFSGENGEYITIGTAGYIFCQENVFSVYQRSKTSSDLVYNHFKTISLARPEGFGLAHPKTRHHLFNHADLSTYAIAKVHYEAAKDEILCLSESPVLQDDRWNRVIAPTLRIKAEPAESSCTIEESSLACKELNEGDNSLSQRFYASLNGQYVLLRDKATGKLFRLDRLTGEKVESTITDRILRTHGIYDVANDGATIYAHSDAH